MRRLAIALLEVVALPAVAPAQQWKAIAVFGAAFPLVRDYLCPPVKK